MLHAYAWKCLLTLIVRLMLEFRQAFGSKRVRKNNAILSIFPPPSQGEVDLPLQSLPNDKLGAKLQASRGVLRRKTRLEKISTNCTLSKRKLHVGGRGASPKSEEHWPENFRRPVQNWQPMFGRQDAPWWPQICPWRSQNGATMASKWLKMAPASPKTAPNMHCLRNACRLGNTSCLGDMYCLGNRHHPGNIYCLGDIYCPGIIRCLGSMYYPNNTYRLDKMRCLGYLRRVGDLCCLGNEHCPNSANIAQARFIAWAMHLA